MSNENPYRPPQSDLNLAAQERGPRPAQVTRAVWLLWASVALAIPHLVAQDAQGIGLGDGLGIGTLVFWLVFLLVFVGICAWLVHSISRGVNWARHAYCGLFVFSAFFVFSDVTEMMQRSVIEFVLNLLSIGLDGVAMFWLYTGAGPAWFKRHD